MISRLLLFVSFRPSLDLSCGERRIDINVRCNPPSIFTGIGAMRVLYGAIEFSFAPKSIVLAVLRYREQLSPSGTFLDPLGLNETT